MRVIAILIFACFGTAGLAQNTADSLLDFIAQNTKRSSLFLQVNGTPVAALNENKLMPLASTVKILVAVEFAKQSASSIINQKSYIGLNELERYHLPFTDGNAHMNWLKYEKKLQHIKGDSIQLIDVARGMMMFSSNANTEYLMELLGLDNVKNNIQLLGIKQHTPVFPLVASLFIYQNPRKENEQKIIKEIQKLSNEAYGRYIYDIHKALTYNDSLKAKFKLQDLTENMQHTWSNRLPASTTKDYARAVAVLNNRKFFSEAAYSVLMDVMEFLMENPENQQWLKHAGMKGGSTAWVLTNVVYATKKDNTAIELAYFFNELTPAENKKLQKWSNAFLLKTLLDNDFRNKMAILFKPLPTTNTQKKKA